MKRQVHNYRGFHIYPNENGWEIKYLGMLLSYGILLNANKQTQFSKLSQARKHIDEMLKE